MFKKIQELQKKPHATRKRVAFGTSFLATVLIFTLWVSVSDFNLSSSQNILTLEEEDQVASPFSSLKNNFEETRSGLFNLFEEAEQSAVEPVSDEEMTNQRDSDVDVSSAEVEYTFQE